MNIVIKGAGFVNKGAEAMARTVQAELAKRVPDCEFFLWRSPQWDCRPALNSGFSPFQLPFEERDSFWHWPKGQRIGSLLWSLSELCRTRDLGAICAAFALRQRMARAFGYYLGRRMGKFDAFVDISGFAYGDVWGIGGFRSVDPLMNYFRGNGSPVVFLPQAWGSFDKPPVRRALQEILWRDKVSFYSRDECSCRYLEPMATEFGWITRRRAG